MNLLQQHRATPHTRPTHPAQLLVVANRLPLTPSPGGGWRPSDGGLVHALHGAIDPATAWLGWNPHDRLEPPPRDDNCFIHPVRLDRPTSQGYYDGFANRTLWPVLHHLVYPAALDPRWWPAYRRANTVFAEAARRLTLAQVARYRQAPAIWVHDYHLMLVPALLRRRHVDAPLAFSFHTPFPPAAVLAGLPERTELLAGVLGADLVSFQTATDLDNFARSCQRYLNTDTTDGQLTTRAGQQVRLAVHPASIDTTAVTRQAREPDTRALSDRLRHHHGGRRIIVGVDRLDYTKGIPERLHALETLAHHRPNLLADAVFVQIGVPTRTDIPEYRRLRHVVDAEVRRINRALAPTFGRNLIDYRSQHLERTELLAHYLAADVALVTALRDGMNLVAKEYVAAQAATGGNGALVLGRNTGAATQLGHHAILCDPFDPDNLAGGIEAALALPPIRRRHGITAMGEHVATHDSRRWATQLLAELLQSNQRTGTTIDSTSERDRPSLLGAH